jgi:hypothetical protein
VYKGLDTLYEVTGLTPGLEYRFAYFAINEFGTSAPSWVLTVASSELPNPPENLQVDWTQSSKSTLKVFWEAPSVASAAAISGYTLQMDDGLGG